CYLLHNPEYFIGHAISKTEGVRTDELKDLYYSRIEAAFEFLEEKVKEGVIACYGISSNTFGVEAEQGDHTDLALVFKAASNAAAKAWGRKKRSAFRCIEMPFNLFELGPLKTANTTAQVIDGTEKVSTLELASRMNLSVLANRPLNAFPYGGGIYRLSSGYSADENETPTFEQALQDITKTEDVLNKLLNGWPSIDEQPIFSFTAHSEDLLEQVTNSVQLDHMSTMFFDPHIAMMNHVIDEIMQDQPDIAESLSLVKENFTLQANVLLAALRKGMREKDAENLKILDIELRDRVPEAWIDAPLQQIAINAIASVPGVTSVLCGMRREAYVNDALTLFEKGDFVDPAKVIGACEELEQDITVGDMGDMV
ncbi:MAG: aryl-alcohol dehydrogenase-like predicted oxidoreductase, partial [bacterium]